MIGQKLLQYHVLDKLGAGGMGEVYLAEDTRLGRKVALKVLSTDVTQDETRVLRFQQEARAASGLNHPNIITIYEIDQAGDVHFIATEFIDGETLRQRIANGRMDVCDMLEIAIQVASALKAAHAAGIVHRDIKPENIMLRPDGYVKVLDFGLAKLTEPSLPTIDAEAPTLNKIDTAPGTIVGTAQYMSPEQARGLDTDLRTDVFSLGAVLYEMLTGHRAFGGATTSDVMVSVLQHDPPPLARYCRDAPDALEWIVSKALRKDKEERYQTVKDMLTDLKNLKQEIEFETKLERSLQPGDKVEALISKTVQPDIADKTPARTGRTRQTMTTRSTVGTEPPTSPITYHKRGFIALAILGLVLAVTLYFAWRGDKPIDSVAILPFVNAGADANMEYLSDGITESIINSLSHIPKLRVVARTTTSRYKGHDMEPQHIGRQLGVRAVLTGKVSQLGETLSIQADLVDVDKGTQLWGNHYTRKFSDVLIVQEEIARQISEGLRLRLTGEEQKQLTKRYTENTEAYELYLKGRYYWNKRSEGGLEKARDYFQQAVDKEPTYALAYAGLADSYALLGSLRYAILPPKEAMPKAKAAAEKALAIDDTLAEAHTSLGLIKLYYDWDGTGAEREFQRAIELNPNYATAHHWYALMLAALGRPQEALPQIELAQRLDPLSLIIINDLGMTLFRAGHYDRASEQFQKSIEMDATFFRAHLGLGIVSLQQKKYADAVAAIQTAINVSGRNPTAVAWLGYTYAVLGKKREAQRILRELDELSQRRYVSAAHRAIIYAGLGEKDLAFKWLEKAYDEHSSFLVFLKEEPTFDNLRSDPRFTDLLERVGLGL